MGSMVVGVQFLPPFSASTRLQGASTLLAWENNSWIQALLLLQAMAKRSMARVLRS